VGRVEYDSGTGKLVKRNDMIIGVIVRQKSGGIVSRVRVFAVATYDCVEELPGVLRDIAESFGNEVLLETVPLGELLTSVFEAGWAFLSPDLETLP
jgi:hypothetical protein